MARKSTVFTEMEAWGKTISVPLSGMSKREIYSLYSEWTAYNHKTTVSYASFVNHYEKFVSAFKDLFAQTEETINDDPMRMTWQEKLLQIRVNVDLVANGYSNGFILSGPTGITKTSEVVGRLQSLGLEFEYFKGVMQNSLELYKYLYAHRDERIIIIDDTNGLIEKDANAAFILSAALDDNHLTDNEVSYFHKDLKSPEQIAKMGRGFRKESAIPNKFTITSGVIFLTNTPMRKIKEAINSRCFPLDFWLTKEETIELIESKIKSILPDAPMEAKVDALNFFKKYYMEFKRFDLRTFKKVVLLRLAQNELSTDGIWEKMAISTVRSTYI